MRFFWGETDQESQLQQIVGKAGTEIGWGKTNLFIIMGETWQQRDQTLRLWTSVKPFSYCLRH